MLEWCRRLHISRTFFARYYHRGFDVEQIVLQHRQIKEKMEHPVPGVDETMCWTCIRDGRTCPWLRDETPVKGWTADPTVKSYYNTRLKQVVTYDSFMIHACPLYIKEVRTCEKDQASKNE